MKKSYHVLKNSNEGWTVTYSGAVRATRITGTKLDAVKFAQKLAKKEGADLVVHKKDGTISHVDNYGPDVHRQTVKK